MANFKVGQRVELRSGKTGTIKTILVNNDMAYLTRYQVELESDPGLGQSGSGVLIGINGVDVLHELKLSHADEQALVTQKLMKLGMSCLSTDLQSQIRIARKTSLSLQLATRKLQFFVDSVLSTRVRLPAETSNVSLSDWLGEKETLSQAAGKCIRMNCGMTARPSDKTYILWSGGAADCVIVATYHPITGAWMRHVTAFDIYYAINPDKGTSDIDGEIRAAGKGAKVYVASTGIKNDQQKRFIQYLTSKGYTPEKEYETHSLAINAKTGDVKGEFKTSELPK